MTPDLRDSRPMFLRTCLLALLMTANACGGGAAGPDAQPDAVIKQGPLGPDDQWTWIEVPGSACMDTSRTGFGVRPSSKSNKLIIFLQDGGACFNAGSCSGVANPNGYDASDFASFPNGAGQSGVFNTSNQDNPFKDWHYVYVPYCSGDIFAGNTTNGYGGRVAQGYKNMGLFLNKIIPSYIDADEVVLAGASAGGFGAVYNYDRTQQAFGDVPVHLLDDSGPTLNDDVLTPSFQSMVRELWNLEETMPEDCLECSVQKADGIGGLGAMPFFLADKYPDRRFALIASNRDQVIRSFFGFGYPNVDNPEQIPMRSEVYEAGVDRLIDKAASVANFNVFGIDGTDHVFTYGSMSASSSEGVLHEWIQAFVDGSAEWKNSAP